LARTHITKFSITCLFDILCKNPELGTSLLIPVGQCSSARETIELLQRQSPDLWSTNIPDLNPVDYRIWGVLQERVYQKSVKDADELKLRLTEAWSGKLQIVIDQAIDQ
jgi:hypothetical protein